ncbi:MAG: hypothetical protein JWN79_633 [Gemmatimonadetes bacterium]|jgi:hypothetical protein|nr:hypothetical protein [Gemmatimonadota bacterium]
MDFAEPTRSGLQPDSPRGGLTSLRGRLRDAVIVLQADGAVTGIHGLSWLIGRRDEATQRRLTELQLVAMAEGWSPAEFDGARLGVLRPRRAEVNALGRAYLAAVTPGAVDAAHRLRTAGVALELSGEVGVEAMLGLADELGVTPDGIHAPRLRFDALGAFVGVEASRRAPSIANEAGPLNRPRRAFVGTRASELLVDPERDLFLRFTGVVAHEGPGRGESIASFADLVSLVVG